MAAKRNRIPAKKGRKCSICTHKNLAAVNKAILSDVSFRDIATRLMGGKTSYASVARHTWNCLEMDIGAMRNEKRVVAVVNVYEEFREQLEFAKQLREAARDYLSDPTNPLRISITPKAHEIEVTYFDHNDKFMGQPIKKKAQLDVLLEAIWTKGAMEPDKYKITSIDLRKFALDAIATTDACIDKFAKIDGLYQKDQQNAADAKAVAERTAENLVNEHGWSIDEAREIAYRRLGVESVSDALH